MKKLILLAILFLVSVLSMNAQEHPKKGAIKTFDGFLLYDNNEKESYTIELRGEVNLEHSPYIQINGNMFQFLTYEKSFFSSSNTNSLTNFINWEHQYLEKDVFKKKMPIQLDYLKHQQIDMVFWYFKMPINPEIKNPVLKTYYLNFIHNQTLFSLTNSSVTGNDKEAKAFLLGIYSKIKFYDQAINVEDLRKEIINKKDV